MTMKNKTMIFAVLAILTLGLMAIPQAQNAQAAGGTVGSISAGVTSIALNVPVALKCYDMTADASYGIEINDVSTHNWTNGGDQTSRTIFVVFDSSDVSAEQVKVELNNGTVSGGFLVIDTIYLAVTEVETFFPVDAVLELLVPLLIFAIAIAIVAGILIGVRRKRM